MKKLLTILLSVLSTLLLSGCTLINAFSSEYIDFSRLEISDIKHIYIVAYGSRYKDYTKMAELTYDDIETLLPLLNQVELAGEATDEFQNVPAMYWQMYRIELENGREFDFAANKNYYAVNMAGYVADENIGNEILLQSREWCKKYFPEDY